LSGPEVPARLINSSDGQTMQIMKEKNVFGRQDFVEWVPEEYDDPRISREHIRIDFEDGKYILSLAKSQVNITKLNGTPLAGEELYELKNNDEIDIASGRIVLRFEVDSEPDGKKSEKKDETKSSKEKSGNGDKSESKK
jgi:pSer/pThr/pTyr-binding forkhead associated (FHA) protein